MFRGGHNIAMKIPKAQYGATVAFYRDILGLEVVEETGAGIDGVVAQSASIQYGPIKLWLDRVDNYARADLWLELVTDDVERAKAHLADHGLEPQDELETLPPGFEGHWYTSPVHITHLVKAAD